MSSPYGAKTQAASVLGLPRGEILGRYESYLDAQKVVDYLADHDFPVANVSIIGNDLKTVERVTAKLSYPKVALAGAAQGAMFGVFVGLILSLFGPSGGLPQILSSVGLGMAIWMIVGVVSYSFRKGKRDFSSSSQVMASNYDVIVAFEHAAAARNLASKLPMSHIEAQRVNPAWAPRPHGQDGSQPGGHGAAPGQQSGQQPGAYGQGQQGGSSATGESGSAAGAEGGTGAPAQGQPQAGRPVGSSYSDLPDGRPQYGIRVEPASDPAAPAGDDRHEADPAPVQQPKHAAGKDPSEGNNDTSR